MADKDTADKKESRQDETEIMTAITAFEQILDAMPNDRASLEALSQAYEQIGDHTRAKDYLIRLGGVMVDESDSAGAKTLLNRLNQYAEEDSRAKELAVKIVGMADSQGPSIATAGGDADRWAAASLNAARSGFNMADELSFAWSLMEAEQLTQDEYSTVVQDLTEMSTSESDHTISVLHVLDARGISGLERIMAYVSEQANTPLVSLASYDLSLDTIKILPLAFMRARGAFVFEMIGDDALIAVMNPFDKQLQEDIENTVGRGCHFYTCHPAEFDTAVNKAKEILAAAEEAAAEEAAAAAEEAAAEAKTALGRTAVDNEAAPKGKQNQ